jgi:hypothetical protein
VSFWGRFAIFAGRPSPEEVRMAEILRHHKRAYRRVRDATDELLGALAEHARFEASSRGVAVTLSGDQWLAFADAVLGEDHPTADQIRQHVEEAERAADVEVVR